MWRALPAKWPSTTARTSGSGVGRLAMSRTSAAERITARRRRPPSSSGCSGKYGTVDKLNESVGCRVLELHAQRFRPAAEVHAGHAGREPSCEARFPDLHLGEIARDLIDQARIVRQHSNGRQWITTNYAYSRVEERGSLPDAARTDFASHTMYLTHNRMNSCGRFAVAPLRQWHGVQLLHRSGEIQ